MHLMTVLLSSLFRVTIFNVTVMKHLSKRGTIFAKHLESFDFDRAINRSKIISSNIFFCLLIVSQKWHIPFEYHVIQYSMHKYYTTMH